MASSMLYTAYQLTLASDISLPELLPAQSGNVDIQIRLTKVPAQGLEHGKQLGPFLWASPSSLWLEVPNVARFLINDGKEILVEPAKGVDEDSIRVFLLGSALGALLFQRGLLVIHGNAIRIGSQCLICVGPSGAGKSTLAAGFMRRGYQVLADDVVPINNQGKALPGFPRIKLWQDVADKLAIDTSPLRRIRPSMAKFNLPVSEPGPQEALPVRWMYILGNDHVQDIAIDPIRGMAKFKPLQNNTYRHKFLDGMALQTQHLKHCGQLAGQVHLARLTRPKQGFTLDAMVDAILADTEVNP